MIWVYFDASALVKRYAREDGTEILNELFAMLPHNQMASPMIGVLEIISVLARKRNDGRISTTLFNDAMFAVKQEIVDDAQFVVTSIDDDVLLPATNLIVKHNINSTDALVLQSCLNILEKGDIDEDSLVLWSCDKRLLRAAQREGVKIFDPEIATIAQLKDLLR